MEKSDLITRSSECLHELWKSHSIWLVGDVFGCDNARVNIKWVVTAREIESTKLAFDLLLVLEVRTHRLVHADRNDHYSPWPPEKLHTKQGIYRNLSPN